MSKIICFDDDKQEIHVMIDDISKDNLDINTFLKNPIVCLNNSCWSEDLLGFAELIPVTRGYYSGTSPMLKPAFDNETFWIIKIKKTDGLFDRIKNTIMDSSYMYCKGDDKNILLGISVNTKD
jgi:hypothetical protein